MKDHRKLVFEPGGSRRTMPNLRESDILSGGDEGHLKMPDQREEQTNDPGYDFAYNDPDGQFVAVQVKLGSASKTGSGPGKTLEKWARFPSDRGYPFDRTELWLLDRASLTLQIWSAGRNEPDAQFGLADVVETGVNPDISNRRSSQKFDSARVEERVARWVEQVEALFTQIEGWVEPHGYSVDRTQTVSMNEEMMQRFAVAAVKLPMLRIRKGTRVAATIFPVGLWVIGANGRVDVLTPSGGATIINASDTPNDPIWMIYSSPGSKAVMLDQQQLIAAIQ
ncbi:hypothetical protein FJ492_27505 [Mesorhizobium sp. B2-5-4]|nr:hypothetical protein FJ492_27505 [Mesorhizobium sp. B2-5-4]